MITNATGIVLIWLALSSAACSSKSPNSNASCAEATSCGGDLRGTWQVDSECMAIDSPFSQPECQSAIRDVSVAVHGTVNYTSGATPEAFTQNVNLSYDFRANERYLRLV